jgi:hypothetical protein
MHSKKCEVVKFVLAGQQTNSLIHPVNQYFAGFFFFRINGQWDGKR